MKEVQETLEDYVLDSDEHNNLKSSDGTYLNFHRQSELLLKGAKLGAKWKLEQDKKLYNEEEVHTIIESYQNNVENNPNHITYDKWFEQFKKK